MSEGGIYLCNWKKAKGVYSLELQANSDITASGEDLESCMEDICMDIISWNGDGEAVLELYPPQKGKRYDGGVVLFHVTSYNDTARAESHADLFDGGVCDVCQHVIGERSATPINLSSKPQGMFCGVSGCLPTPNLFRKKFVNALSDDERREFEARPALFEGKETDYVELVPQSVIRCVGYKGAEYPKSFHRAWRCSSCDREYFSVVVDGVTPGSDFIDSRDIDGIVSTMIFIDDGRRCSPAFRNSRWKELLQDKSLRGMLSGDVVVVEPDYVEHPELDVCDEFEWIL